MTRFHSQSAWKGSYSSWWRSVFVTLTHTCSDRKTETHTPLLCFAHRLVQSHMLSAWTNTFPSACPPFLAASSLFLSLNLYSLSPYSFLGVFVSVTSTSKPVDLFYVMDLCAGVFPCLCLSQKNSVSQKVEAANRQWTSTRKQQTISI